MKQVSIIMRTKNSSDIVRQTLKALFSQDFKDFDLFVIDSGSTDNTLEIVQHTTSNIVTINASDYYPGKILNEAIAKTSSEIIVFLNSDAVLLIPQALSLLLHAFINPQVHAAFGRQLARPDAKTWVQRDYLASFPDANTPPSWMFLSLPFAAIRRSTWEKHPFYTAAWGSEDMEWGHWALQEGLHIQYVANALVMHSHNYTLKQLYGRRYVEGEADAFIFKRSYPTSKMLLDWLKASTRDVWFYMRSGDYSGILSIPIRRFIYYWAYAKGHRLGMKRIATGNTDASKGQKEVLKHY
jgi:rhamnosyltransferase